MRILVAEDDAPLAEFLHQRLLQEKFAVQMVASGPEARRYASDQSYDLVVLDLNRNGRWLDALRSIRFEEAGSAGVGWWLARIWWKTASEASTRGLMTSWPTHSRLQSWRRAFVRWCGGGNRFGRAVLQVSDLELDRITHGLQRQGRQIDLSPKEFSLLELLMRHAVQPVSRPAIVEPEVWKLNLRNDQLTHTR